MSGVDDSDRERRKSDIARGAALGINIHLLGQPLVLLGLFLYGNLSGENRTPYWDLSYIVALVNFGLTQVVYVVPIGVVLYLKGQRGMLKGFATVAAVLFCVNGTCTLALALAPR